MLADIGDGQSLEQSLSTFSGHVRRLRNVLATATRRSLVLLDEARPPTAVAHHCLRQDPPRSCSLSLHGADRQHESFTRLLCSMVCPVEP